MAVFHVKLHFTLRKSATKFLCVNTISDNVVSHSLAYPCKNCSRGTSSIMWKFGRNWPILFKNANFHSILARSASAV